MPGSIFNFFEQHWRKPAWSAPNTNYDRRAALNIFSGVNISFKTTSRYKDIRWKSNYHCQCHNVNEPSLNAMLSARGPVIRLISSPTRVDHLHPVHQVLLKPFLFSFTGLSSLQVSKVPSLRMSESPIQTPPVRGRDVMEVGISAASASCSSSWLKTENRKPKTCSCWLSTVARVPPCCTHMVSASNQSSEVEESCQHLVDDIWENALYFTIQTTYTIYSWPTLVVQ